MKNLKVILVLSFLAIWSVNLLTQWKLGTINDWIYVDLIFCMLSANYLFWFYKYVSTEGN
ncbi:hypothetical protein [Lysinibacillus sp. NPDC047702]|uniref:hypothetical protein n=1 Tax=unclassified Lysinibacillus TaxID=2636778 RepID=UPI003D04BD36